MESDNIMSMQQKKAYIRPELKVQGTLEELTQGQGWNGDTDQFWILCFHFEWGEEEYPWNSVS
jgi:hypothetical protein